MNNRPWRFSIQRKTLRGPKDNSFDDGKRMLDERRMDAGCKMLDTGYWMVDAGSAKQQKSRRVAGVLNGNRSIVYWQSFISSVPLLLNCILFTLLALL